MLRDSSRSGGEAASHALLGSKGTLHRSLQEFFSAKVSTYRKMRAAKRQLDQWERDGRPIPAPNRVKQQIIKQYGRDYALKTLVETGTFRGDMIHACRKNFHRIISIELDPQLYQNASRRFKSEHHIKIYEGDSGSLLPQIIAEISEPCLFWLDGHYSEGVTARGAQDTPIMSELAAICDHCIDSHVVLIDDARLFTGQGDYPTIEEVRYSWLSRHPKHELEIDLDIIRITPPKVNRNP